MLYGGNVVRFLVHFFFTAAHFHFGGAFLILSPPPQNFHVVLPTKECLLCFLSLALDLCRPFSQLMWSGWVQGNSNGPLVPMVRLVPMEKHPIPVVQLVNMHLIKGA